MIDNYSLFLFLTSVATETLIPLLWLVNYIYTSTSRIKMQHYFIFSWVFNGLDSAFLTKPQSLNVCINMLNPDTLFSLFQNNVSY